MGQHHSSSLSSSTTTSHHHHHHHNNNHHHHPPVSNNININNHHHGTIDISEEDEEEETTDSTTPTSTPLSSSSSNINLTTTTAATTHVSSRRRSSLPHKLKDNNSGGTILCQASAMTTDPSGDDSSSTNRETATTTRPRPAGLAKAFKSATHLDEHHDDIENNSSSPLVVGTHLWDSRTKSNTTTTTANGSSSDSPPHNDDNDDNLASNNSSNKSKRNNTLPLTITTTANKENESPVHRSNTHPHLYSRNFREDQQQHVTYSNNSTTTPNSATYKTSQKLIKLKPFSTPDLKRSALLNSRNHEENTNGDSDSLTPTISDEISFNSTSISSPPQNATSFRNSVLSTTSSASSSGSSSIIHNPNNLIHSLFPSLPVDRLKMSDEEFVIYKEVISKPVYEKILKSKPLTAKCGFNEEYMKEFAFELSDEEELKNTYLTTDWVETAKLLQRTRSIDETILNLDPKVLLMEPTTISKRDSLSSIEEEVKKIVMDDQEFLKQDIKIKLIITEIANAPTKTLRQFLSPVLHKMNVLPEIGWFHSAILVGKWRLDFNDSSVVIPRKLVSQAAVITTDIETISTLEDLNRVIDGMSRCICKWNRSITYKQTGGDRITTGNCQDFVEDLLDSIGVKMNLSGSMKKFVKRLRKTGKCSLVFEMDKKFREHFGVELKRVKFKSHEQLDLFVRKLLDKCPNFAQEFTDEWILLQSFDRTYWLKHITYAHIEEYKPCKVIRDNKGVQDCPFHEPEFTNLLKD